MKFLVRVEVRLPATFSSAERAELLRAELERGLQLRRSGAIERIWRIPGGLRNVGIWEARDATELHDMIASVPLFDWIHVEVVPLAEHPIERELRERGERPS